MIIKAMTYNIQHTRDFLKKGNILNPEKMADVIKRIDPDFCVLNEVFNYHPDSDLGYVDQDKQLAEMSGMPYNKFFESMNELVSPYGNAIISKKPIISFEKHLIPRPNTPEGAECEQRSIFKAEFDEYVVFGTHFGLTDDEQKIAVDMMIELISAEKKPYIICGDLNVEPDNRVIKPLLEKTQDTYSFVDGCKLSFPSDKPKVKIDYILTSNNIKVIEADIPSEIASDHRPYYAILEI